MNTEHAFLITYGLHNFVTHAHNEGHHTFTIHAMENPKLVTHAKSLIAGNYGQDTTVRVD